MNIKINKKLVTLMVAGGVAGFVLTSCLLTEQEISVDTFTFDEVISEIEEDSTVDDILLEDSITLINPVNGEFRVMDMMEASRYLERLIALSKKLDEMQIDAVDEDDELYNSLSEEVAEWTIDDAYDFIDDIYYDSDGMKKIAYKRLSFYKLFLDKELRTNGFEIATKMFDDSISQLDLSEDDKDYRETLDSIVNIRDNIEEIDYMEFNQVVDLLDHVFDLSKSAIYESGGNKRLVLSRD